MTTTEHSLSVRAARPRAHHRRIRSLANGRFFGETEYQRSRDARAKPHRTVDYALGAVFTSDSRNGIRLTDSHGCRGQCRRSGTPPARLSHSSRKR